MTSIAKKILSILSVAVFLTTVGGPVGSAFAAETWPVWPPKKGAQPPGSVGQTGEQDGERIGSTIDYGTIGKYALGIALVGGVLVAIGSGGGGTSSSHTTP